MNQTLMTGRAGMGQMGFETTFDPLHELFHDGTYDVYTTPTYVPKPVSGDYGAPPWWAVLGPGIIQTARDVFAPVGTSQAAYGAQYSQPRYSTVPAGYTYNAAGQLVPLTAGGNAASVNAGGVNILGANIPWLVLAIGAGILFFPGFTRRR